MGGRSDDGLAQLVLADGAFEVQLLTPAHPTQIGNKTAHYRGGDRALEGEDLREHPAVIPFGAISQPPHGDVEQTIAMCQTGEVHVAKTFRACRSAPVEETPYPWYSTVFPTDRR